jgi:phosphatidate cytidylyltransferase
MVPMKMAIHNTFAGLFWFLFPFVLVAINDTFAYFSGFFLGRKVFGDRTFLTISPNKTWEGFIGGGLCTIVAGFFVPLLLNHKYLTCSFEAIEAVGFSNVAACVPDPDVFGPNPDGKGPLGVQYHGMCLAFFASTVAPFGGFFASAIKRAYGLKDFANWIPGHGGFMDRFDCQFLMALATFVHLTTFVLKDPVHEDVSKLVAAAQQLSPAARETLRAALTRR